MRKKDRFVNMVDQWEFEIDIRVALIKLCERGAPQDWPLKEEIVKSSFENVLSELGEAEEES